MTDKEKAIERMKKALPYMRCMVEEAKEEFPKASVELMIAAKNADGSGKMLGGFKCEEFFADLALIIDQPEVTEDDRLNAAAMAFRSKFGLTVQMLELPGENDDR